jgi:hypothetical protein
MAESFGRIAAAEVPNNNPIYEVVYAKNGTVDYIVLGDSNADHEFELMPVGFYSLLN